jgi:hypothetical protein
MRADPLAKNRNALDQMLHPARRRDTDRVGQHELVGSVEVLAELCDGAGVDLSLERAAPRARDRDGDGHPRGGDDRAHALDRLGE